MEIKASIQRDQIGFGSIEDGIERDNAVRVIEAFVAHIDLKKLEFEIGEEKNRRTSNLKRSMKILGTENMIEKIKNWKPNYKAMCKLPQK